MIDSIANRTGSDVNSLLIVEELLLMLLKDEDGSVTALSPNWHLWCGFAGAVLLDLSFLNRIDADASGLHAINTTPTGNILLDPTLKLIATDESDRSAQYWIERLAMDGEQLIDTVLERLVTKEILFEDSAGFWSLTGEVLSTGAYPIEGGEVNEEVRTRIRNCVLGDEIPFPHDVTLIALLRACDAFKSLLTLDEYELAEERINLLAGLDLFGRAILDAVNSSYMPPTSILRRGTKQMPRIGLWDCLKSASMRNMDFPKFVAEQVNKHGPVIELKLPGRRFVILAGEEANRWINRRGRLYLRTRDYLENFQTAWGAARSIASMDGADHYRMRQAMRHGNSRPIIEDRLDEVYELGRDSLRQWTESEVLPGEISCQRFTGRQIARLTVSVDPSIKILDDLIEYEFRALKVHVMRVLPKFTLKTPGMKKKLQSILELYAQIHSHHSPGQRLDMPADLADDLLKLHQSDPQFVPATDLEFAFIAPLIAGHYMGSALSFALYEMMANPEMAAIIESESDALFQNGDPNAGDLTMQSIDFTHRFVMEVLRLHPVIPMHFRTAMNSFELHDVFIPERSSCMVVYPATHFMPEFFPEPNKFDPDRFADPRNEHQQTVAYRPFGLGTHTCLGSRFAEINLVMSLLLIARHVELELVPKTYRLKLSPLPKFSPNRAFKFKVKKIRNPIE